MRKQFGLVVIIVGGVGVLLCVAAIALGWRFAVRTVDRIDRVAASVDTGLVEADARLARVETRVSTLRTELRELSGEVDAVAAENPELPAVRARIEGLVDRVGLSLDRLNTIANALSAVAAGLRGAAEIVIQLNGDADSMTRVRSAAQTIDRAADALNTPQVMVDAVKSAKAVELTQRLVAIARETVADSDLLAEGLAATRQELAVARMGTVESRNDLVYWIYAAAIASTFLLLWIGLGQLCMIGWGRRRISQRVSE